jgi:hypothetical protein
MNQKYVILLVRGANSIGRLRDFAPGRLMREGGQASGIILDFVVQVFRGPGGWQVAK